MTFEHRIEILFHFTATNYHVVKKIFYVSSSLLNPLGLRKRGK